MADSGNRLVWVDLETTGLDPEESGAKILEFAVIVTTDDDSLTTLVSRNYVIEHGYIGVDSLAPEVLAMHANSGLLLDLIRAETTPWFQVAQEFTQIVQNAVSASAKKPLLAGSTVGFDRTWLAKFAPAAMQWLFYRNLDVSSIYEMLLRSKYRDEAIALKDQVPTAHRAQADIEHSIYCYREFRQLLSL